MFIQMPFFQDDDEDGNVSDWITQKQSSLFCFFWFLLVLPLISKDSTVVKILK